MKSKKQGSKKLDSKRQKSNKQALKKLGLKKQDANKKVLKKVAAKNQVSKKQVSRKLRFKKIKISFSWDKFSRNKANKLKNSGDKISRGNVSRNKASNNKVGNIKVNRVKPCRVKVNHAKSYKAMIQWFKSTKSFLSDEMDELKQMIIISFSFAAILMLITLIVNSLMGLALIQDAAMVGVVEAVVGVPFSWLSLSFIPQTAGSVVGSSGSGYVVMIGVASWSSLIATFTVFTVLIFSLTYLFELVKNNNTLLSRVKHKKIRFRI